MTIAGLGHNNPPPDLVPDDASLEPREVMIAARALKVICDAVGNEFDPHMAKVKKVGGEYMRIRNLWLYAMNSHIPRGKLAIIAQLNPKTVTTYRKQMDEWGERNGLLRGFYDMILDMVEPIPGIVDDAQEALADMAVEASLDRMRKSVDGLSR